MTLLRVTCPAAIDCEAGVMATPRQGIVSGKTLDTDGQCLSSIIPGSWKRLLTNVCLARRASNVFRLTFRRSGSVPILPAMPARD